MQNSLTVQSHDEIMSMAKMFQESKMFTGIDQVAQAFVKIQAGREMGITPFSAMSGIHIIQGKATVGANLMAAGVKGSGKYDYKVVKLDEKICSIDFFQGTTPIGNSTFTIDDAKKAGTKNIDKFPKNMLFARAMSNGQRWYCPDVFTMPVYTPEEMGDPSFVEDIQHEEVAPTTLPDGLQSYIDGIQLCTTLAELAALRATMPTPDDPAFRIPWTDKYLSLCDADQLADMWESFSKPDKKTFLAAKDKRKGELAATPA